uniref:Putative secreted protein n=1 Tax=Ixodes ricinus TaxID=34613 RepID=A0A6B0UFP9_IXORI
MCCCGGPKGHFTHHLLGKLLQVSLAAYYFMCLCCCNARQSLLPPGVPRQVCIPTDTLNLFRRLAYAAIVDSPLMTSQAFQKCLFLLNGPSRFKLDE